MAQKVKKSACNVGDVGSLSESGRSLGEGNGSGILAWRIPWTEEPGGLPVHGVTKSRTRLSNLTTTTKFKILNAPKWPILGVAHSAPINGKRLGVLQPEFDSNFSFGPTGSANVLRFA